MGVGKHEIEIRGDAWLQKAYYKSYRCAVCGVIVEYCDREAYFRSGLCGAHAPAKDDGEDRRDH